MRSASVQGSRQKSPKGFTPNSDAVPCPAREQTQQMARVEREETEARTSLIKQEARRTSAETWLIEAEARQYEADTEHTEARTGVLDFAVFRLAVFFVLGIAIAVIVTVRLLTDPAVIDAAAGSGMVAACLMWVERR